MSESLKYYVIHVEEEMSYVSFNKFLTILCFNQFKTRQFCLKGLEFGDKTECYDVSIDYHRYVFVYDTETNKLVHLTGSFLEILTVANSSHRMIFDRHVEEWRAKLSEK